MSHETRPKHSWILDVKTAQHAITLTSGEILLVTEDKVNNELEISLGDRDQSYPDGELSEDAYFMFDTNICHIGQNGVLVLPNSGEGPAILSRAKG